MKKIFQHICHSGLDPESILFFVIVPAGAISASFCHCPVRDGLRHEESRVLGTTLPAPCSMGAISDYKIINK